MDAKGFDAEDGERTYDIARTRDLDEYESQSLLRTPENMRLHSQRLAGLPESCGRVCESFRRRYAVFLCRQWVTHTAKVGYTTHLERSDVTHVLTVMAFVNVS